MENRLAVYRKQNKLTQDQLAFKLGISQSYISKVENFTIWPNFWFMRKLYKINKKLACEILEHGVSRLSHEE